MDLIQGMIYLENGQSDLAETNFRKVIETNPAHPRALLFMAQTLTLQREYDQAGIYFELAQLYPEVRYDAYYAHAQLLLPKIFVRGVFKWYKLAVGKSSLS